MPKLVLSVILLCCTIVGLAQSHGTPEKTYSFPEMRQELKSRGYDLVYPSSLENVFSTITLPLNAGLPVKDFLKEWLSGLEVGFQIDGKNIVLFPINDRGASRRLYAPRLGVVINSK